MDWSLLFENLKVILPQVLLVLWACALLMIDLMIPKDRKMWTAILAALGLLMALGMTIAQIGQEASGAFGGMVIRDGFAVFLNALFLFSGLAAIAVAYDYLKRMGIERGEYYTLLLFSITGMMLMAQAGDLIIVFLALELLSIPLYILAGFARPRPDSEEAALKYFLLGAFAGGFLVYGVALVYGATGTTALTGLIERLGTGMVDLPLLVIGAALILVGLGFKVAAVPFHMWTPDVYHGAPSSVTAFMSVGAKAAGFAALLRIFIAAFPTLVPDMTMVVWILATLTMFIGNIVAIAQSNIKRMLAYSSIAHAGYILMAMVTYGIKGINVDAVASALFYLVAYAFTSFGAWSVVIALEKADGEGLSMDSFAGLGRRYPLLAASMAVFMLSFTGVPPTLGFLGKFFLFRTVVEGGFIGLAVIGVLTSLISAYYYLRVIVIMYMQDGEPVISKNFLLQFTAVAAAVLTVILSLASTPILRWASQATLWVH